MLNHMTNSEKNSHELREKPLKDNKIASIATKATNRSSAENPLISDPRRFSKVKIM